MANGGLAAGLAGFAQGTLQQRDINVERERQAEQVGLQREQLALQTREQTRRESALTEEIKLRKGVALRREEERKVHIAKTEDEAKRKVGIAKSNTQVERAKSLSSGFAAYGEFVSTQLIAGKEMKQGRAFATWQNPLIMHSSSMIF